jgi:hypothetical protein
MTPEMSVSTPRSEPVEIWVSITRYAEIHAVSRPTVYKWLDAGLLSTYRVDGVVRVRNIPPGACQSA